MGTLIIVVLLAVIIVFAVKSSITHMKGEGGCCGGGSLKSEKKKLEHKVIAQKILKIEGMHCDHCKNSVERAINEIDGAAAKVHLKKGIAVVSMDRIIADDVLKQAVEKEDFTVTDITSGEV